MKSETLRAMRLANPDLSRFDPLDRILLYDDFDDGLQGWISLIGNYERTLDSILPDFQDLRPPMLSNLTAWDTGTAGSFSGTYAMKLATRAKEGSLSVGLKRFTFRHAGPIRVEAYFTFKPEANELLLSETDVRAVGFLIDLQVGDRTQGEQLRVMPHLRYLNALHGEPVGRWQFKQQRTPMHAIGDSGKTVSHFHLSTAGWEDIPGADQLLCYNEIATKQNWHYLRVDFDLESMSYLGLQCNDRVHDVSSVRPMTMPAMANLWCMVNPLFWVETDTDKRAFLYVDSVVISAAMPDAQ